MREAGAWVFAGGLEAPDTATVCAAQDGEVVTTDGPFAETKEHLGGFCDRRGARPRRRAGLGPQGRAGTTRPIEVRPFQDEAG